MTAIASLRVDFPPVRDSAAQPTLVALKACPWFAGWPVPALSALAAVGSLRSFGPGQIVMSQGKPATTMAVVVKGRVRAVRRAEGGREVTLESFRPGDLCLDALFEPSGILQNDWVASDTSLLMFVPRDEFLSLIRTIPEALFSLARDMERRLARVKSLASSLALADVQTRLHHVLSNLAREEGEQTPEGTLVRRSPTQQEMGNMIGACRETVSRMIAELVRQGLVVQRGRRLLITPRFLAAATASAAVSGEA